MLRSVYLKTLRDRWLGAAIGVVALFLVAWMGIAAFSGMDDAAEFIEAMPEAYLSITGISSEGGVVGMMLSNMFNFMGPFVVAGLGVSMAAAAIAGEEVDGTMNVLGAAPRSRSRLLASKALAAATVVVATAIAASLSYALAASLPGEDLTGVNLTAATVHLVVVALLFAAVALAIGAATGNRAMASAVSVGLIVVSFFVAGILPLVPGWEDVAKASPWYWLNGPAPMLNGVDWAPLLVLLAIAGVLVALAFVGVNRRDLGSGAVRAPLMDRLRADPRLGRAVALVSGAGSTRGIAAKALTDVRALVLIGGAFVAFQSLVVAVLFNAIGADIGDLVSSMPDAILAMIGFVDMSTPEGFLSGEVLSIVAPLVTILVGVNAGAALVGEERRRTSSVLLVMPVSRAGVAWRKAVAVGIGPVVVGVFVAAGFALGNAVGGLGMSYGGVLAAGVMVAALGWFFGALAFAIGGVTGRAQSATAGTGGLAVLAWGANAFLPVNPDYASWARLSPLHWYAHDNPLESGVAWDGLALLAGLAAVLVAVGVAGYARRDLRG
ncbi:ABC transporter permease subunit [Demequina sp. NBRC 110057]|uniref:ABC transporter permease subunit n=1 Tax=Demequina sp. NBRC 110057 TaxID=1570346 RepID=UPI0009FED5AE|nr:ABC transporter permease subunit [Demequina sp. NBRC 110057]